MSYATQQMMIERFGGEVIESLTDIENAGQIDAVALQRALDDADGEINAYIVKRYDVPLLVVADHVVRIACDLAFANLYKFDMPEDVKQRRADAIAWLTAVANSRADIPGVDEKAGAESAGSAQIDAPDRVFSRDTLKDF